MSTLANRKQSIPRSAAYLNGLLFLALTLCGGSAVAQTSAAGTNAAPGRIPNRWLIIVETSRPMQRRAEATHQVCANLLLSGMRNQIRSGDTVGVWTFNETLKAGEFPLQVWTPQTSKEIARNVYHFVRNQKNEKDGRLEAILPQIEKVIRDSDFITVVIVSSGHEMRGSPFDGEMNETYRTWRDEQERTHMPFVTILRGEHGTITSGKVNMAPFPPDFPPLPAELVTPKVVETKPAPTPKPPTVPPLIVSNKKPEPAIETPAPEKPAAPVEPVPKPAAVSESAPAPVVPETAPAAANTPVTPAPSPTPTAPPPSVVVTEPPPKTEPATDNPAPTIAAAPIDPRPASPPEASPAVTAPVAPVEKPIVKEPEPPKPSPATAPTTPVPVAKPAVDRPAVSSAPKAARVQTAVSAPSEGFLSGKKLWIIAGAAGLACIAAVVIIVLRRRNSNSSGVKISLISRSLDDKK